MTGNATLQGVYVNVPVADWSLFRELVRKFGWKAATREDLLDRFVGSRPAKPMSAKVRLSYEKYK